MALPRVSTVVVNWNRANDLRECLESIRRQTFGDVEIIVVDNHSIDGSAEMIATDYPNVRLIVLPDSNHGACEAFNIGFRESRGEYVVAMDNDALLEADWIEKAVLEFQKDPGLGAFAGRVLNWYTKDEWGFWAYGRHPDESGKAFYTSVFVGCSVAFRKEILSKVGGYPERYYIFHNEYALGAEIVAAGHKILYSPSPVAYHKVSPTARSSLRKYYYETRNWYWILWQYYPWSLALLGTVAHFLSALSGSFRFPRAFLTAHIEAARGLETSLRNRKPLPRNQATRPWSR